LAETTHGSLLTVNRGQLDGAPGLTLRELSEFCLDPLEVRVGIGGQFAFRHVEVEASTHEWAPLFCY
jgi:hypothetical protein